jgi:hypothetical protein
VTFAYMQGTIHPYYTVALAPAIGALVGTGSVLLWRHRAVAPRVALGLLALTVLVTCGWGFELLRTDSSFHPSVKYLEVAAAVAAVVLLAGPAIWLRNRWRLLVVAGTLTAMAVALPTAAWALGTAATPHSGSIPTAVSGSGNAGFSTGSSGGSGGFRGGAPGGGFAGPGQTGTAGTGTAGTGTAKTGSGGTGTPPGGTQAGSQAGELPGGEANTGSAGTAAGGTAGSRTNATSGAPQGVSGQAAEERGTAGAGGAPGGAGFGGGTGASAALVKALEQATTRWAAAVTGSQSAASLELASGGKPVMAMGGFTGSDPSPTLAEFKAWVKAGDITYYIAGGGVGGGPGGQGGGFSQITAWVEAHYKSTAIAGETVYLLLQPKS